ncbi:hypothetical protein CP964_07265 [Arcobacter defluvii]|uniref:Uncharacterized protein n=1 Tax=Arcobacter defluvii TaxID=873191 RepID=A0AAE7BD77_9BACT|nr:hypothetical protein ADFLV_1248 [Arcobacter defluvii]QKF77876.1 hypothetical protein ADFLV_1858 [Arcobacter defluvii]RXI32657.1 hypothetical protein CP964_07265 [Arcobacter defluvii]
MSEIIINYIYPLMILILLYISILQEYKIKAVKKELNLIKQYINNLEKNTKRNNNDNFNR